MSEREQEEKEMSEMNERMNEMSERMREMSEEMKRMSEEMKEMNETNETNENETYTDDKGRRWRNIETVYVIDSFARDDGLHWKFDEWLKTCRDEGYDLAKATDYVASELFLAVEDEYDNAVEMLDGTAQVVMETCLTHPMFLHIDWDGIAGALLEDAGYGQHDEWTRASRDE